MALSQAPGEPTIGERRAKKADAARAAAAEHPLVKAVLETFPGAKVDEVRKIAPPATAKAGAAPIDPADPDDVEVD